MELRDSKARMYVLTKTVSEMHHHMEVIVKRLSRTDADSARELPATIMGRLLHRRHSRKNKTVSFPSP